jgi:DNA-binding MarR family transcriptional regulator
MNTNLLRELINLGEAFEQQYPDVVDQTVINFLAWSTGQSTPKNHVAQAEPLVMPKRYTDAVPELPTFIVQYMTKTYRYFKLYMKKACENSPLLNYDDFIALVYLAQHGSMTKTHMVETTVNEKTSGMLVINRLIDQGFIEQTDNPTDRRSRCITLTDAGMAVLQSVQPGVNQAVLLLTAPLSETEQEQLARFLYRLEQFHEPLYLHHRDDSLAELMAN